MARGLRRGGIAPQRRQDPTLAEYANPWLDSRELKPRTRAHYRNLLDNSILPPLGNLRLARLSPETVRAWYTCLDPSTPTLREHTYALLIRLALRRSCTRQRLSP